MCQAERRRRSQEEIRWTAGLLFALLALPSSAAEPGPSSLCRKAVTVRSGDTLSALAQRCDTTPAELLRANPEITNPNVIPLGATLRIPGRAPAVQRVEKQDAGSAPDRLLVEPSRAARGARVTLSASGLPPGALVWVKGGRQATSQLIVKRARTDAKGRLRTSVVLPSWSGAGRVPEHYLFSVQVPQTGETIHSAPVLLATPSQADEGLAARGKRPPRNATSREEAPQ